MQRTVVMIKRSLVVVSIALVTVIAPAEAQELEDGRWMPFVGCWEPANAEIGSGLLCFNPADGGLDMHHVVGAEVISTERLIADGALRSVTLDGCEGAESVEFSADGRRAYTRSEFSCVSNETRSGTGLMAFISPGAWVDVRSMEVDGETVAWAQPYYLVEGDRLAVEGLNDPALGFGDAVIGARMAAARMVDLDHVQDALAHSDAEVVETWLGARQLGFILTADDLVRLSDNGVPGGVIDVVVALSFPSKFAVGTFGPIEEVEFTPRPLPAYNGYRRSPYRGHQALVNAQYYGYGTNIYGYNNSYRYPNAAYGSAYGYPSGTGYLPQTTVTERKSSGRAVKGRGYTRGSRPRSGAAQPSYSTGSQGSGSSSAGSSSSGSTGSASGSSGSSTRRKAVRRPPPGG
jgi:hypothetical protein